jgi:hypothetical protein
MTVTVNVVAMVLAVLPLVVGIPFTPFPVAVAAYLAVFRVGLVLTAVEVGLAASLTISRGTNGLSGTER